MGSTVAAYTAYTRNMIRVSLPAEIDNKYPSGVGGMKDMVGKVLCHPICSRDGELEAIVELIRTSGNMFTDDDCEVRTLSCYKYRPVRAFPTGMVGGVK